VDARADESSQDVLETTLEPEPKAPEEPVVTVEPEEAPSDDDITLEAIMADLKRREGRQ
jgi:hypothetical protein